MPVDSLRRRITLVGLIVVAVLAVGVAAALDRTGNGDRVAAGGDETTTGGRRRTARPRRSRRPPLGHPSVAATTRAQPDPEDHRRHQPKVRGGLADRARPRPEHDVHPHRHRLPARRFPGRHDRRRCRPGQLRCDRAPGGVAGRARSRPLSPTTAATPTSRTTRCTGPVSAPRARTRARRRRATTTRTPTASTPRPSRSIRPSRSVRCRSTSPSRLTTRPCSSPTGAPSTSA